MGSYPQEMPLLDSTTETHLGLPDEIIFRKALATDHFKVVDIGKNLFGGMDYLDFCYPYFIHQNNIHCFLLEHKDIPVSFMYCQVADDGEAILLGGARTLPSYKGKGLSILLTRLVDHYMSSVLQPAPSRQMSASDSTERYLSFVKPGVTPGVQIAMERWVLAYKIQKWQLDAAVMSDKQRPDKVDIWRPSKEEFIRIVGANQSLFPEELMFVNWHPLRIDKRSNLDVVHRMETVFASGNRHQGTINGISTTDRVLCQQGIKVQMVFYGSDKEMLLQHVMQCVIHTAKSHGFNDNYEVNMKFFLPISLDTEIVKKFVDEWKWEQVERCKKMCIIARDLTSKM